MIFSEQLIHLIDEFAKRIGIIIDWTSDNVIPYLHDLITRYGQFHLAIKWFSYSSSQSGSFLNNYKG